MSKWTGALVGAMALLTVGNAIACPPPPPGPPQEAGESDDAYAARIAAFRAEEAAQHAAWSLQMQQRVWDEADSVFIARIERVGTVELQHVGDSPRVALRPVRSLKGRRYASRFMLRYTEMTSCGPIPSFDALRGHVGDEFVVFVRGGRPRQASVRQAIAPANITEPRVRAALDAAPR
jgi:hypothetical protein